MQTDRRRRLRGPQPIVDPAERGEEQHRGLVGGAAQRLDEIEAVEARQHTIDHRQVVVVGGRQHQSVAAVVGAIDLVPTPPQHFLDIDGGLFVIFDQQDLHADGFARSPSGPWHHTTNSRARRMPPTNPYQNVRPGVRCQMPPPIAGLEAFFTAERALGVTVRISARRLHLSIMVLPSQGVII
jgi:hypothetical protein